MLTGFAGYSGNRGVGVGGDTVGCRLWGIRVKEEGGGCQVCVCRRRGSGLSAPRRQPLNPCRPEWWCLS